MLLGVALRKALHFLHSYAKRRKDESAVEGLVIIQAGVFGMGMGMGMGKGKGKGKGMGKGKGLVIIQAGVFGMGVSAKINTRGSKHFGFKLGMVGIS